MPQDDRPHRTDREVHLDHLHVTLRADEYPDSPDLQRYPYGGEEPTDPGRAGRVGKRKGVWGAWPDSNGNRAERRAAAKAGHKRMYGGKGGTHRAGKHKRR